MYGCFFPIGIHALFVCWMHGTISLTELRMFQTSLLSVASFPKNILPVIAVSKSSLIPFPVGQGLKVWIAGGGEWWPTNVNSIDKQAEIKSGLMEYLNAVAFPNIVSTASIS